MQRYSSTWSKFVQTSIAFHQNLSKEGRSMMLEDHIEVQLSSAKDKYQTRISDKYRIFHKYQRNPATQKFLQPPCVIVALTDGLEN